MSNSLPVVTVKNLPATHFQVFAPASLFTVNDPDGDAIASYAFWDTGTGGGYFVLAGVVQPANQEIDVTAAQLIWLAYESGSGADTLWVRANDGIAWGGWSNDFTVTAPIDNPPVVTGANLNATHNQAFGPANLLSSVSDADGDTIRTYAFWNTGTGGGHFVLNGVVQAANQEIDVPGQLVGNLVYQSGSGTDTLWAKASDGILWGGWSTAFTVTAPIDNAPVVHASNVTLAHGNLTPPASSLFSVSDADGDGITTYGFWDNGAGGGHFVLNGVVQANGQEFDVSAGQLAQLTYQNGSGADTVWVKAKDQILWGDWSSGFTVAPPSDHAPVVDGFNFAFPHASISVSAQAFFNVSDIDGDTITTYGFWNDGAGGGHFWLNGVMQPNGQEFDVTAAQLAQLRYVAGSGVDTVWVKANDGIEWGGWSNSFTVTPPPDQAPVVTTSSVVTALGDHLLASNLFGVTDADHDAIAQYDFWDTGGGGGHFALNGVAQPTNGHITVTAAQLAQLSYQPGSGADTVWVRANDGWQWSGWSPSFTVTPQADAASVKLNDAAMWNAGAVHVVSTFTSGGGVLSYIGPITFSGFTLTNTTRTDSINFVSPDSTYAANFGEFFDGARELGVPAGGGGISTIRIQAQDNSSFSMQSIDLDTLSATAGETATFTGTRADNSTVTQTFNLDSTLGLQTFQFSSDFTNLKYLDFAPSANQYFDNVTLTHLSNTIAVGATFELGAATARAMTFAGSTGTLKLDDSVGFTGTVAGMTGSDRIDFGDISFAGVHTPTFSGNASGGTLTVTDGTHTAGIALIGNYLGATFVTSSDGRGGTFVV